MKRVTIGQRYGRLTVAYLLAIRPREGRGLWWGCKCDCGNSTSLPSQLLGRTQSCGCLAREITSTRSIRHGLSHAGNKTYKVWVQMRRRCREKEGYADRGIRVCERWQTFENFLADMGEPPAGMTIERKENNGDYEPENCVWADSRTQANNRRSSVLVTANGVTKTATEWSRERGIQAQLIRWRLKQGWTPERALDKVNQC